MTREQYAKAKELDSQIEEYRKVINNLSQSKSVKLEKDKKARWVIEHIRRTYHEEWQLRKFFTLIFKKRQVNVLAHYEFAEAIELDAEPELIDLILDYLQKKKATLEKEFEQIGGGIE